MTKLIALVGYKGSGKSTICRAATKLLAETKGYEIACMGLADPIYDMLAALGVTWDLLHDKTKWDTPLDILCGRTLRYASRTLGTEWGREWIGDSLWTLHALARAQAIQASGRSVIIDNVRYPSESWRIRNEDGIHIAFKRDGLEIDLSHSSEQHIKELQKQCEWTFNNDKSFNDSVIEFAELLVKILNA